MKRINLPTWLTIGRIGITPLIVLLLYFPNRATCLAAVILYMLASASDYFDGKLARRTKQVTSFGKFLDPLADKVLNCSILIMLTYLQWVQAWVVLLIVCRELMVTGLRAIAADEGHVMAADGLGKLKTVCQGVAIIPLMLHFTWFGWNLQLFGEIVLYIALALTVTSGAHYFYAFYKNWRGDTRQSPEQDAKAQNRPEEGDGPESGQ